MDHQSNENKDPYFVRETTSISSAVPCKATPEFRLHDSMLGNCESSIQSLSKTGVLSSSEATPSIAVTNQELKCRRQGEQSCEHNGVARGIVLNPSKFFGVLDNRWASGQMKSKVKDQEMMQNHMVSDGSEVPANKEVSSEARNSEMSFCRKTVFGLSLLPSIMFVLSFIILLPCNKSVEKKVCANSSWTVSVNKSALSADLALSNYLIVGLSSPTGGNIMSFIPETGETVWDQIIDTPPLHIHCKYFDANNDGSDDCLVTESSGKISVYSVTDGHIIWNVSYSAGNFSLPAILSDCDGDGIPEIAISSSAKSQVQIVTSGKRASNLLLTDCLAITGNFMPWARNGVTDLIILCENKDGSGSLRILEERHLCVKKESSSVPTRELLGGFKISLEEPAVFPNGESLIVWAGQDLVFFDASGSESWRINTETVVSKSYVTRFVFCGKFRTNSKEVALVTTNGDNGTSVVLLNCSDGNVTLKWSDPTQQAENAVFVSGTEKDYIITLLQKRFRRNEKNSSSEYVRTATEHADTTAEIRTNDVEWKLVLLHFPKDSTESVEEKQIFFENYEFYAGDTHENTILKSSVSAGVSRREENLSAFLGRTSCEDSNCWTQVSRMKLPGLNKNGDNSVCR